MPDITIAVEKQIKLLTQGKYCNSDIIINPKGIKLFGAIGVNYPAGSTLTCSNGVTTFVAETTSGSWVFAVPESGAWTITATDGTNTKSQSVTITSKGEFKTIELKFQTFIYQQGVTEVVFSNAWSSLPTGLEDASNWYATPNSISIVDGIIVDSDTSSAETKIVPARQYDLTNIDTLFLEIAYTYNTEYPIQLGVFNTWPYWGGINFNAMVTAEGTFEKQILSLDVSKITGKYWVGIYGSGLISFNTYNMWY